MTTAPMHPQPCALCGGETVRRDILPGDESNHCPRCGVWTASSDGQESSRRQRYVDIAWPIAVRLARLDRDALRRGGTRSHHAHDAASSQPSSQSDLPQLPRRRPSPRRSQSTRAAGR